MKLALFGETGPTGTQLIELVLSTGNQVFAYARNPSKIGTRHERLVDGEQCMVDTCDMGEDLGHTVTEVKIAFPMSHNSLTIAEEHIPW